MQREEKRHMNRMPEATMSRWQQWLLRGLWMLLHAGAAGVIYSWAVTLR